MRSWRRAHLLPQLLSLVVIGVDREPQPLKRKFQLIDEQIPGELDRVALEVVAEGKVAQHLKEGVMARAGADILQIVVFAAHAQALLRGGGALVAPLLQPQKHILELHHAGVDKQQSRVVCWHKTAAVHDLMLPRLEILEEKFADLKC